MKIEPYLNFNGRCEEAIEFYKKAVGAQVVDIHRFSEVPDKSMVQPGSENKIMHATLRIGDNIVMASDGQCTGGTSFQGFSMSVGVKDEAEAKTAFNALSEGGTVQMPLSSTFFASSFGIVADRFGLSWMVIAMQPQPAR